MGRGCGGRGDVEVKEIEHRWVVYERAENDGYSEWAVGGRWERCWWTSHVLHGKRKASGEGSCLTRGETYELKLGLAALGDTNGLNAFFARDAVVEAEESLVGLDAFAFVSFGDLEGKFEGVRRAEGQWLWFLGKGEAVWVGSGWVFGGSRCDIRVCAQLGCI